MTPKAPQSPSPHLPHPILFPTLQPKRLLPKHLSVGQFTLLLISSHWLSNAQTYYWNVQAQMPSLSLPLWGVSVTSTLTPALVILSLVVFDSRLTSLVHPQEAWHTFCGQDPAASHAPGSQTQRQTLVILVHSSPAEPAACFPLATNLKMPLCGGWGGAMQRGEGPSSLKPQVRLTSPEGTLLSVSTPHCLHQAGGRSTRHPSPTAM